MASTYVRQMTEVDFSCTATRDDVDTDGITIPANSVSGGAWIDLTNNLADRSHSTLIDQSDHEVIGSAAAVSSSTPSWLAAGNLGRAAGGTATGRRDDGEPFCEFFRGGRGRRGPRL